MATENKNSSLELQEPTAEQSEETTMYLDHGRTLAVSSAGDSQIVQVRASSGQVELSIRMTEDGPVMQLEGVKLEMSSQSAVSINCETFEVQASKQVDIASQGGLDIKSEEEMHVESTADVRVRGEKIWLN